MREDRPYYAAADVLRVLAIFLVGWYHIWQQSWLDPGFRVGSVYVNLQQLVRHGYLLVDVLLVISGFLLALPVFRAQAGLCPRPAARDFYKKRFLRVFPSYALAIALVLFFYALPNGRYASAGFLVKDVLAHLTFTHNLFYDTYFMTPLPIVLWTMGVEVQLYLLFPLVARFLEEAPRLACLALAAAALAFRAWVFTLPDTTFWVNQLPGMLDLYACGFFAAYLSVKLRDLPKSGLRAAAALAVCVLCLALLLQLAYRQPTGDYDAIRRGQLLSRLPIGFLCGAFLLCGGLLPPVCDRIFGNPLTKSLSAVSYNFYIWHQFIAVRLKVRHIPAYVSENPNMAGEQPWQTRYTLLCFAAALAFAALVTYLWERPLSRRGRRRLFRLNESGG